MRSTVRSSGWTRRAARSMSSRRLKVCPSRAPGSRSIGAGRGEWVDARTSAPTGSGMVLTDRQDLLLAGRPVVHVSGGDGLGADGLVALDGQVRQDPVEPAGQPPVGPADPVHDRRDDEHPDHEGVVQHRCSHAKAEELDGPGVAEDEGTEDEDHDRGSSDDHAAGVGVPDAYRLVVPAVTTPNAAATETRFMTAPTRGTRRLRKARTSRSIESPMTTETKSGNLAWMVVAKSSKVAVGPPTQSWLPVSAWYRGPTSPRTRSIRSLVAWSCGLVVGTTRSTAAVPSAFGIGPTTEATPGSDASSAASGLNGVGSPSISGAAVRSMATTRGPLIPGPKPSARAS